MQTQKMIASRILKCGVTRVWLDPSRMADIEEAITASDVRALISKGLVKKLPKQGLSNYRKKKLRAQKRKGRRKGHGKRKGSMGVRINRKRAWIKKIRIARSILSQLRDSGELKSSDYRSLYRRAKGGLFRNRAHVLATLEKEGYVKKESLQKFLIKRGE